MTPKKLPKRMQAYLETQRTWCKPSTLKTYRTALANFHRYLRSIDHACSMTKKQIRALTPQHLHHYLVFLQQQQLVPYTKLNYLIAVKQYLAWEIEQRTIPETLLHLFRRDCLPKVPEYLPRPLSAETDRRLQSRWRLSSDPYDTAFLLLRHTGLRISELIQLPWNCVVTTANQEKYLKVPLGKMDNERLVPLTTEAVLWIEQIKAAYPFKKHRCDKNRLIGLKGCVDRVYPQLARRFKKSIGTMTDQDKPITFHRLRHTYATALLTGGVSIVSIMKLLGHRRIEMSLRYTKVAPNHLRSEYLKAIQVIEQQAGLTTNHPAHHIIDSAHPSAIIRQLGAFVSKTARITPAHKKNLLLRLRRLHDDLNNISFSQQFTTRRPMDSCASRLAG